MLDQRIVKIADMIDVIKSQVTQLDDNLWHDLKWKREGITTDIAKIEQSIETLKQSIEGLGEANEG